MNTYHFSLERYQIHNPLHIVENQKIEMTIGFPYQRENNEIEEPKRISLTYDEVYTRQKNLAEEKERKRKEKKRKSIEGYCF
jgi:hypothetical protein